MKFKFLRDCGFLKQPYKTTISDVDDIQTVCTEFLLKRSAAEIQQFIDGLNALDIRIGRLIKSHPTQFKELFGYNSKVVTPHDLDLLFLPILPLIGSNSQEKEKAVVLNWKDYIYGTNHHNLIAPRMSHACDMGGVNHIRVGFLDSTRVYTHMQYLHTHVHTCNIYTRVYTHSIYTRVCFYTCAYLYG